MLSSIISYFQVTKPRIWSLLVFTSLGGFIVASGRNIDIQILILVLIAVTFGSAGANTITCYFDRDMDAIMNRTYQRPLPRQKIQPALNAFIFGLILSFLSILIAILINPISALIMIFGIIDNVIIYSKWLKRRNPMSIILGGFSGGAPALIGYASVTNSIDHISLSLAALVVLWIPGHIWSLALHSKEDYAKARVPMLPVVVRESVAIRCIASTSILMVIFSALPYFLGSFGIIYLYSALVLGGITLILNFWLIVRPTKERAWIVFKFSSPYLALIFISMMVDKLII